MRKVKQNGFLTTDLITAISLLALIITLLTISLVRFARFNHYQWARQRCTAAAMAELDCLTATGTPIDAGELKRLWPEVSVSLERAPAEGSWQGLERVQVVAATRRTTVRLTRYIRPEPTRSAEGGQL